MTDVIHTRQYREFRAQMKSIWQAQGRTCAADGQPIDYDGEKNQPNSLELDHIVSRKKAIAMGRPELLLDPNNAQPLHHRCNRIKGAGDMTPTMGETTEDW